MRKQISAAHLETAPVLEEAAALLGQKEQGATKQALLEAFNAHFTISEDDLAALTSSAEPVDDRFFLILARTKKINEDCEVLLGTENQRLGVEILEQSSRNLNGAFQKLYRWTQREFKSLNLENPQISSSIRRALRVLAERPTLFQSCLDFFAEGREHVLTDSFYVALTGSSSNQSQSQSIPTGKPIELAAHDPLRYVGDMLAWIHSTSVSEREALEALFVSGNRSIVKDIQAGLDSEPWSRSEDVEGEAFDGNKALNQLVNRDLAGVTRVLRQRIEQVVQSHEEVVLTYKLTYLINFYRLTLKRLLGEDSAVLEALSALEESGMRQFRSLMRDHVTLVQSEGPLASQNLSPPNFLRDALEQLKTLMQTFDTSLTPDTTREQEFEVVLQEALDPFMSLCERMAKPLEPPKREIFALNCLGTAKMILSSFLFAQTKVSAMSDTMSEQVEMLVNYQHNFFLQTSGLDTLLAALEPLSNSEADLRSIFTLPAFQTTTLEETSQALDEFLPSALIDATENIKLLQNPRLVQEIAEEAANRFCEEFETVEQKIMAADELRMEEDNDNEDKEEPTLLRDVFPRTSGEIRVLLS